jgi:flagellar biosynthesis/type III secretory pathway protein FliH
MKIHEATEQAYKNGYEDGKRDAVKRIAAALESSYRHGYTAGIKEFAERLKEYKYQSSDWSHGEHPFVVEESDIYELVEEMVGDGQ